VAALLGVVAVLLVGCSSGSSSVAVSTATTSPSPPGSVVDSSTTSIKSTTTTSVVSGSLVGTWTAVRTFVPVGCAISEGATGGSCPPAVLTGWDEVRILTVAGDGTVTLRFPDTDGSITTTCTGRTLTTVDGLSLVHLSCHGKNAIAGAGFAKPVRPILSGGCLVLPDDVLFERNSGDCAGAVSTSTMTFAPVGTGG
jgi:hypothetical protein